MNPTAPILRAAPPSGFGPDSEWSIDPSQTRVDIRSGYGDAQNLRTEQKPCGTHSTAGYFSKFDRKRLGRVFSNPAPSSPVQGSLEMTSPAYPAATHFSLPSGSRVLDRYTIRRGLGIGGFGEVYFAISDAGKEVAIKRIQRNLEIELRGVSHCLNLKHPNLVSLYDVCRDESQTWWVVMEYVAGASLRDALDRQPAGSAGLGEIEARRWFAGAAAGVAHLHSEGLVHRDLKPGNLFDDYGIVKVGDYGLSKFISESRRGGQTESVGTFHYMAPEIGRGEYGREIDLYALGVILYESLTGRLPFEGETAHEIIVKHLSAKPDLSGVAEPYRGVIEKALRKDPRQRWTSASEMAAALRGADSPLVATLVSRPGQTAPSVAAPVSPNIPGSPNIPFRPSPDAFAATSVAAVTAPIGQPDDTEPLARAVGDCWRNVKQWWNEVRLSPIARVLLVALVAFVLVRNLRWLLPLLTIIGFVYVPYYVIRQMLLGREARRASYGVRAVPGNGNVYGDRPGRRPAVRLSRSQWRKLQRAELAAKKASSQLAELSGSWIAVGIATLFCVVAAGVIGLRNGAVDMMAIAPYGWVMMVSLAMSVVILGLGKLWEVRDGDPLNRRIVLAGSGGLVGAMAFLIHQYLMIPFDPALARVIDQPELPQALYEGNAVPRMAAWMAHFAILMAAVRWWRLTDPLRMRRLSVWMILVVVVADWLIQQVVPIAQPWGMLVAGTTVIAVQIAATWESTDQYPSLANAGGMK
jgi:serine/threonine protein kinase